MLKSITQFQCIFNLSKKIGNYKRGDFPFAEKLCDETVSLPVHDL